MFGLCTLLAKDLLLAFLSSEWDQQILEALIEGADAEVDKEDCGLLGLERRGRPPFP